MFSRAVQERDGPPQPISILDWARMFAPGMIVNYQGMAHQAVQLGGYGGDAYDTNSVVFACMATRMLLFSEARFAYQHLQRGRAADLWVDPGLAVLEQPWPGAQTGDLLSQAELDILACGNSYWVRDGEGYLVRLDPNRVTLGSYQLSGAYWGQPGSLGTRVGIYTYQEGPNPGDQVEFLPTEICHYKPYPRRLNLPMGMSWLSPALPDTYNDNLLTNHKGSVLRQGANLSYVVTLDPNLTQDRFEQWVDWYKREHEGAENAGKTLFVAGGADVKTVSQTFEQLAVKATQGAGETRIAACAGVPPVLVGLSEGLAASTYSNYAQARRRLVDGTLRPLWRSFAGAMQSIIPVQSGNRLWYDDRDIPFLREDVKDQAEILARDADTIVSLIKDGFTPDSSVDAVVAGDLSRLVHTGLVSVQLQPPQEMLPQGPAAPGPPSPPVPEAPAAGPAGELPPARANGGVARPRRPRAIPPPPRPVVPTL
jgi:hypothetical protein